MYSSLIQFLSLSFMVLTPVACWTQSSVSTSENAEHIRLQLEKDLLELVSWMPGEYDNHEQVYREAVLDTPQEKRHRHTHHIFSKVELDYIDGHTIYAQQSQHYDLDDIYRQRIYSFGVDVDEKAIRLTIYTPKDPKQLIDAHVDPSVFDQLSKDDFYLKPGCEVFWIREENHFKGYLKDNACHYYSNLFETEVFLNETLILRKDALLLDDKATDAEGRHVFGVADKGPTVNLKNRCQ